jgi:group I intron endonuclease
MNKERIRGIYIIVNLINKKVYIGESLDIYRRWEEHEEDLNNNKHHSYKLQQDWNTYGKEEFKFEIVEEIDKNIKNYTAQYVLIAYEDKYIKKYDSINTGYNVEETLKEIQLGNKSITNDLKRDQGVLKKVINNMKKNDGIFKLSEETLKRRDRDKNLKSSKVYCIEQKQIYNTAKEATQQCNVSSTASVTTICKKGGGKAKLKDGTYLTFMYKDDYISKYGNID